MRKNRILSVLCAGVVGASCMIQVTVAAEMTALPIVQEATMTYDDLTYDYAEDGTYMITDCDESVVSMEIPEMIDGVHVTIISFEAFQDCTKLTSVVIPDSVTAIYSDAFAGCTALQNISIPSSVELFNSIYTPTGAASAFADTPWLKAKQAENPLVIVNDVVLDGTTCTGNVTIPDGVTQIADYAFVDNTNITSVTIPESVTVIRAGAFFGSYNLTDITIPSSIAKIEGSPFFDTAWLTAKQVENPLVVVNNILVDGSTAAGDIVIPEGVTLITNAAFSMNTQITGITFPSTLQEIPWSAFWGCSGLTEITIPEGVTYIGGFSFYECTGLQSISLPKSLLAIDSSAFAFCDALTEVYYNGTDADWDAVALSGLDFGDGGTGLENVTIHTQSASAAYAKGDTNNDSNIDITDATAILNAYASSAANLTVDMTAEAKAAGDIDGDGTLTISDATAVLTYYAKTAAGLAPTWDAI